MRRSKFLEMRYYEEIAINADLEFVEELLVNHKYIKEWEAGIEIFKELRVDSEKTYINHWDIENNIDYIYTLKENIVGISLCLEAKPLEEEGRSQANAHWVMLYVSQALRGIKRLAEAG